MNKLKQRKMAKCLNSVVFGRAVLSGQRGPSRVVSTSTWHCSPPPQPLSTTLDSHSDGQRNSGNPAGFEPKGFNELPGPRALPLLGNYMELHGRKHEMHSVFTELRDKYGDIYKISIPSRAPMIVLSNLAALEKLYRNEGSSPIRTQENGYLWYIEKHGFRQGLIFSKGEEWKVARSALKNQTTPRYAMHYTHQINRTCQDLVSLVRRKRNPSSLIISDLMEFLPLWSFEGICMVLLNESQGLLSDNPSEQALDFKKAAFMYTSTLIKFLYSLPLYKIYPTKPYVEFDRAFRHLLALTKDIIVAKKLKESTAAIDGGEKLDQIGFFDGNIPKSQLFVIFAEILSAGIDTTSNAVAFLLHEVAKQPDIQKQLFEEVSQLAGEDSVLEAEDVSKLKLTKNCVKEALRLYPISHLFRGIQEDLVLCGYRIPKGVTVLIPLYTLARDEKNFAKASEFRPERWDKDASTHSPFAYSPFGLGPRSCYGKRIAEMQLTLLLAQMVRSFTLSTKQASLRETKQTLLQPSVPVEITFEDRKF